ncbi:MAG: DUF362 domain-containing protein [Synergistaceae bacterium]|nr:DUF362 domain-containing protein [Synergistaceae bacterium]MBQ7170381.1 DUF362 domain-containing protein [Synergistaceae bacterium]
MSKIFNIYGTDSHSMTLALLEAIDAASLVPSGANVALKPNLVVAGTPDKGATTHAGVLAGCIEYFRDNEVRDISIIEGSWVGAETMRAMKAAGYDEVCRRYNVPFTDLKHDKTRKVDSPIGPLEVCELALDAGFLVNLPVLKGHCQTKMTCALKNLKGCLPDREKSRFHALGLSRPIAALGAVLKPGLVIVDSICGDLDFEEGGNPVHTNRMFCGTDPVMIDAYGAGLMGLELFSVPYIQVAEKWGAGSTKFTPDDITDINSPESAGSYPRPSGRVAHLTRNVHEDSACSACYAALVRALHTDSSGRGQEIYIGQGWRGKKIPDGALGIGRCCSGAGRNVKGCPPDARTIAEMF